MTTRNIKILRETSAKNALLSDTTFQDCLRSYFHQTHHVRMNIEFIAKRHAYCTVNMVGLSQSVDGASEELSKLLNLFCTMRLTESTSEKYFRVLS